MRTILKSDSIRQITLTIISFQNQICFNIIRSISYRYLSLCFLFLFPETGLACVKDPVICDWLEKVLIIRADRTTASAVEVGPGVFVTNKHVVTDNKSVLASRRDGKEFTLYVVPNLSESDLVLLTENNNKEFFLPKIQLANNYEDLRVVAYGIGRQQIRIFPTGGLLALPPENKVQARIHTTVRNLPGISGGALINGSGSLVGIVTAGSGKYNEAFSVRAITKIGTEPTPISSDYMTRGRHIKHCSNLLSIPLSRFKSDGKSRLLEQVEKECSLANTKTFYDMVGQLFGNLGLLEKSLKYLNKSVLLDPNSPTSLISLSVALQFKKDYKKQIETLDHLLTIIPNDPLVSRMAVQAAALEGDKKFAEKALNFMVIYNPAAVPQASQFIKKRIKNF